MSLLIKALDKAQEAKAQEAKAQDAKAQAAKSNQAEHSYAQPLDVKGAQAGSNFGLQTDATNPESQPLENEIAATAVNSASVKLAAANALEMELSPISNNRVEATQAANNSEQASPDIFSITSTFKVKELASNSKAYATSKASAKSAANVFSAKRIESNNNNTILALSAAVALCIALAVAAYFYLFMESEPDFVIAKRTAVLPNPLPDKPAPVIESSEVTSSETLTAEPTEQQPAIEKQSAPTAFEVSEAVVKNKNSVNKTQVLNDEMLTKNEVVLDEMLVEKTAKNQTRQSASRVVEVEEIASKSASIQVSKTKPELGVNPILMDAFNAYNQGNDAIASKLYRQVLQRDLRNVDALLGLGAIAQRQGRLADANGWYAKVLEVEPRNVMATSAILDSQPQNNVASNESRIKNMLAKQPEDSNLHAALGNFYADLNQWPAAQQAYFEAYRLNASADNSFNLSVSLDQLNKPKLALPYYQRALELSQSSGSNIDKAALAARITAIQ